jgi:hypothetical protein
MNKLVFILSLSIFSIGILPAVFAQVTQDDFQKNAVGRRWGLRYFIEKYPVKTEKEMRSALKEQKTVVTDTDGKQAVIDTLIKVHDCQQEFLELRNNNTFSSTNVEDGGTWSFTSNNEITFRKANGAKYMKTKVNFASADSLILVDDENPNDIFIQVFKVCALNDTTFADSREVYKIWNIWGVTGGVQWWEQNTLLELGITRWRQFEWNRAIYAFSANLEIDPVNGMHGASLNLWSEDKFFAYGIAATTHTDFKNTFVGIKPLLGLSLNRLFSNSGYTIHALYGYNFNIGSNQSDFVNRHSITVRFNLPFKRTFRNVVRKADQENDYN